jgi:hypothetical protein
MKGHQFYESLEDRFLGGSRNGSRASLLQKRQAAAGAAGRSGGKEAAPTASTTAFH